MSDGDGSKITTGNETTTPVLPLTARQQDVLTDAINRLYDENSSKIHSVIQMIRSSSTAKDPNFEGGVPQLDPTTQRKLQTLVLGDQLEQEQKRRKQQAKADYYCPQGHILCSFPTNLPTYYCDVCNRQFPLKSTLFGCRECDWDACEDCIQEQPDIMNETSLLVEAQPAKELLALCRSSGSTSRCRRPRHEWDAILQFLSKYQDSGLAKKILEFPPHGNTTTTPLHWICRYQPPMDVVQMFLEITENSLLKRVNEEGYLPIHILCKYGVSDSSMLPLFITNYPESIQMKDREGYLPIHLAACRCLLEEQEEVLVLDTVKQLHQAYPPGIEMEVSNDSDGKGPYLLHRILNSVADHEKINVSLELIECICSLAPKAVTAMFDNNCQLPIHLACCFGGPWWEEVIKILYNAYPESITIPNDDGYYPSDLAEETGVSASVMDLLIARDSK